MCVLLVVFPPLSHPVVAAAASTDAFAAAVHEPPTTLGQKALAMEAEAAAAAKKGPGKNTRTNGRTAERESGERERAAANLGIPIYVPRSRGCGAAKAMHTAWPDDSVTWEKTISIIRT